MTPRRNLLTFSASVAALASAAFLAGRSGAAGSPAAPAPAPVTVATIDLTRVMQGLEETKAGDAKVNEHNKPRVDELKRIDGEIQALQKQLEELPKNEVKQRIDLMLRIAEQRSYGKAKKEIYQDQSALESGEILRDVYMKIVGAVEKFARSNGYDVVLRDDRGITLPVGGTESEYGNFIAQKRMMYAKPEIDITDQIITLMNNDWAAGGGKAAPAPTPAPATPPKADSTRKK